MAARAPLRDLAIVSSGVLATAATVGVIRLVPDVSPTTAALALLLVVLLAATYGRLWIAIVVALAATLALNFYFLPPVGTLTIADPQNWVALAAFLLTAVIASNLSAAAQARASEAVARRHEVTRLFDLTRDVLLTTETASAIDALARHVARRFELRRVAICLPADHGWSIHQGGTEEVSINGDVLNTALAKARGTLEFDASQTLSSLTIGSGAVVSLAPNGPGAVPVNGFANDEPIDNAVSTGTDAPVQAIPEPGALSLFAIGVLGLLARRRQRAR